MTLTYDDRHLPPTLAKPHLSGYIKRVRAAVEPRRFKFFASGEYGEKFGRPHYHALIFGLDPEEPAVKAAWKAGLVHTARMTPATIAYVAGYTAKKIGFREAREERVNYETGEVYTYQPPFVLMSRGGRSGKGIAGEARDEFRNSWRDSAILQGRPRAVPRYLHQAWLDNASESQISQLQQERESRPIRDTSRRQLAAQEAHRRTLQSITANKRKLDE